VMQEVRVSCCKLSQDEILVQYFEWIQAAVNGTIASCPPRSKKFKSVLSAGRIVASFLGWGRLVLWTLCLVGRL
jgi:hypothetical protein